MKIDDILNSNKSYSEKLDLAIEQWNKASEWMDKQTDVKVIAKYYEHLQETLEAVRHLYCMKNLGYDPVKDEIKDFNHETL